MRMNGRLFLTMLLGTFFLSTSSCAKGTEATAAATKETLATVSGQALKESDLAPLLEGPMRQLRSQEYQIKSQALETLIQQKLIEAEAKKKGIATETLLAQEVDAKIPESSEEEVQGYYLAQQAQLKQPLEAIKPQIRQQLKQAKAQQARQSYLAQLRAQAKVVVHLAPPKTAVSHDPARVKGKPDAPITIVEFSDFQCPFCQRTLPTLTELLAKYEGKVRVAYRDFPLPQIHPHAQKAAEAARCAADQGKFWEYHDRLFANQGKLDPPSLTEHAKGLALEAKSFEECLSSGKYTAAVGKDFEEGKQAGVSGTPAFFINGIFLNGAQPLEKFSSIIEDELTRVR